MTAHEYLSRHGGRLTATLFAGVVAMAVAIGTARADIAPRTAGSTAAQALLASLRPDPGSVSGSTPGSFPSSTPGPTGTPKPPQAAAPAMVFAAPLPGFAVNSPFGVRELSLEDHARVHEGVDIAAPQGEPIHATAPGEVVRAGLSSSYGNFVEVDHGDGVTSFYAHMRRPADVSIGERVSAGEVLGYVGSTGHSTGPHLHFEIRKDGQHFDPSLFINHAFATLADLPFVRSAEHGFGALRAHVVRASFTRAGYVRSHMRWATGSNRRVGGRVHHSFGGGGRLGRAIAAP